MVMGDDFNDILSRIFARRHARYLQRGWRHSSRQSRLRRIPSGSRRTLNLIMDAFAASITDGAPHIFQRERRLLIIGNSKTMKRDRITSLRRAVVTTRMARSGFKIRALYSRFPRVSQTAIKKRQFSCVADLWQRSPSEKQINIL